MTARETPRIALTIAGSDSGGGAGIQADLKTFAALGVYGASAITAVTAQNTIGVTGVALLAADFVGAQIEAVAGDLTVHATKTGMLGSAAIVEVVAASIRSLELPCLVVDPVMVAKSGDRLVNDEGVQAMCAELLPQAAIVTPNLPEAEVLARMEIRDLPDRREAARRIHRYGAKAVLIKGGHGEGPQLIDLLFDGAVFTELAVERIDTRNTHGTGCTFASAIAAQLALGDPLDRAVIAAQAYVAGAIRHGLSIGRGHGPLDHFWRTHARTPPAAL